MPFIAHDEKDIASLLSSIGVDSIEELFDEIPVSLRSELSEVPSGLHESSLIRVMQERAPESKPGRCFLGAGAYEHFIPSAVWELVRRGEFYTAYTPYQAEASQGSLQVIYEYQSMMTELMEMDVSNASLYEGATALVESVLMAIRIQRGKARRIVIPATVSPVYREVLHTFLRHHEMTIEICPMDESTGTVDADQFLAMDMTGVAAVVMPMPNFLGCLEQVDRWVDYAHEHNALVIAVVNPISMAMLTPPGQWGKTGADIVCGEGQPLGIPLSLGGPYFGFLCTRQAYVRQLPGRIVGKTTDADGNEGYVLTLQAREQHIRRSKATSNICTNQGLMVVAATIFMRLKGGEGLYQTAQQCYQKAHQLYDQLVAIDGVMPVYSAPFFHEFALRLSGKSVELFLSRMRQEGIEAGIDLNTWGNDYDGGVLIAVTETKTDEDLQYYSDAFQRCLVNG